MSFLLFSRPHIQPTHRDPTTALNSDLRSVVWTLLSRALTVVAEVVLRRGPQANGTNGVTGVTADAGETQTDPTNKGNRDEVLDSVVSSAMKSRVTKRWMLFCCGMTPPKVSSVFYQPIGSQRLIGDSTLFCPQDHTPTLLPRPSVAWRTSGDTFFSSEDARASAARVNAAAQNAMAPPPATPPTQDETPPPAPPSRPTVAEAIVYIEAVTALFGVGADDATQQRTGRRQVFSHGHGDRPGERVQAA